MAYTFQSVLDTVDNQNQGTNIFGGGPGTDQGSSQQNQGGTGAFSQGDVGSIQGGTSGSTSSANASQPQQTQSGQASGASAGAAVQRNVGRQAAPVDTNQIAGKVNSAKQSLQQEANSYVDTQKQKGNVGVADDELEKGIGGDYGAYSKIANLLGQQNVGDVDQFKPQTQTDIRDVKNLQTDAGVAGIIKRKQGPLYTAGEAALDTSLLRKDKNFSQARQDLVKQQNDLNAYKAQETDPTAGAQTRAQSAANEALLASQQGIKGQLSGKQSDFEKQQQAELAAEQEARRNNVGRDAYIEGERQRLLSQWQQDPRYADVRSYGNFDEDLSPYLSTAGADNLNWKQAVDQGEADKYNRIADLLGNGGERLVGGGFGDRYGFNEGAAMQSIAGKAGQKRAAAEQQNKVDQEKARQAQDERNRQADDLQRQLDSMGNEPVTMAQRSDLMGKIATLRGGSGFVTQGQYNPITVNGKAANEAYTGIKTRDVTLG